MKTGYMLPLMDSPGGAANKAGSITTSVAGSVMGWRSYTSCSATSGSSYGGRFQHYVIGAAGSGAALRVYGFAYGAAAANVYGLEATAEIHTTTSSDITGEMAAVKATATVGLSTSGTVKVLDLTMNTASGKTMHADSCFIKCANAGSGADIPYLFHLGDAIGSESTATMVTTGDDAAATHYVKLRAGSTTMWLLATTTTPNVA